MGIIDYSNVLSLWCLRNIFPDTRTENAPLFLAFFNPPSSGSGQSQSGSSTGGESMTIDGSCDRISDIKCTMI
eukprot:11369662-Ditylum_brightwellii.AAC.1